MAKDDIGTTQEITAPDVFMVSSKKRSSSKEDRRRRGDKHLNKNF